VVQIIDNNIRNYKHKGSNKRFRIHYRNYSRRRNWDSRYVLAIPILAILKIVFDRIESLEAWGYLMETICPKILSEKIKGTGVRKEI
jgi:hypothetical protein